MYNVYVQLWWYSCWEHKKHNLPLWVSSAKGRMGWHSGITWPENCPIRMIHSRIVTILFSKNSSGVIKYFLSENASECVKITQDDRKPGQSGCWSISIEKKVISTALRPIRTTFSNQANSFLVPHQLGWKIFFVRNSLWDVRTITPTRRRGMRVEQLLFTCVNH